MLVNVIFYRWRL